MKFCIKRFYCCNGLKEQLSYTKSTYLLHVHTPLLYTETLQEEDPPI